MLSILNEMPKENENAVQLYDKLKKAFYEQKKEMIIYQINQIVSYAKQFSKNYEAQYYAGLALSYLQDGNENAIAYLEKAIQIKSDYFVALIMLAQLYCNSHRYDLAFKYLTRATLCKEASISPNDKEIKALKLKILENCDPILLAENFCKKNIFIENKFIKEIDQVIKQDEQDIEEIKNISISNREEVIFIEEKLEEERNRIFERIKVLEDLLAEKILKQEISDVADHIKFWEKEIDSTFSENYLALTLNKSYAACLMILFQHHITVEDKIVLSRKSSDDNNTNLEDTYSKLTLKIIEEIINFSKWFYKVFADKDTRNNLLYPIAKDKQSASNLIGEYFASSQTKKEEKYASNLIPEYIASLQTIKDGIKEEIKDGINNTLFQYNRKL